MNPNPTPEQLAARLNPTAVNIQSPLAEGLFKDVGGYGAQVYKRNADGTYSQFDVNALARAELTKGQTPDQYGNYSILGGYNSGGQASYGLDYLKKNYGFDYNSLPTYNLADLPEFNGRAPGKLSNYSGDAAGFFTNPKIASQAQTTTINNTPNAIATPEQIAQQQQNPLWNAGAGKPLPDTSAPGQVPGAQPLASANGNPQQTQQGTPTAPVAMPDVILQPGATGNDVKKLQDFLVSQGLMTAAQVATGYGIYGPQTTAAVQVLQQKLGVDNSSGPGFFGPKTIQALKAVGMGSNVGASATGGGTNPTAITGQPTPSQTATGKTPLQNVMETYSSIYKELGIGDIKTQYEKTLKDQEKMTNDMNDEIAEVNDDPWLSQGVRDARVKKIQSRYETKLNTLSNFAKLYDSLYQEGIEQAKYLSGEVQDQTQMAMQLAQKKEEALDGLKNDNTIVSANGRELLVNKASGKVVADLGASKVTGTGDGGFSAAQINSTINSIASSFDNEPIVKNFNVLNEGYQFAKGLSNTTTNPADDQGLIYAFAKAMDPNSVVREGEYSTVQKYAQSWVTAYGKSINQAINGTGFLSEDARKNIKKTIEQKYQTSLTNYQNVYSEYQKRIEQAKAGGGNNITNYANAYTAPQASQPINLEAWMSDYNYNRDIADAKAAIQKGADPVAVKARLLTKYKEVNL